MRAFFSSRRVFLINILLSGLLLGFILAAVLFSCSTQLRGSDPVAARDRESLVQHDLHALQSSFREVASVAGPSVVRIDVEEVRTQAVPRGDDSPWFDFFFQDPEGEDGDRDRRFRTQGLGSGVVVRREENIYYILTNDHVVGNADAITVTTDDGEEYEANIVGKDARKDLALLSVVTPDEIPVALLGDSDTLMVGDWVLAIGSPFGFQSTVTAGIVSAVNRRGGPDGNISDFIQTDAAINRGNSGGALINLRGEVVGINTWITSQTGGSVGLGFSIPINNVKRSIDDFIETGSVRYGWLGVSIRSASPDVVESLQLPGRRGALVHHVFLESPAHLGGLLPGDFITEINGVRVDDSDQLVLEVGELPVGRIARFEVIRYGERKSLEVRIAERESDRQIAELNRRLWPGISVFPVTPQVRSDLELDTSVEGVLISTVESRTLAASAGIRVGDIVVSVNGNATPQMLDFYREVNEAGRNLRLSVLRNGSLVDIEVTR